MAIKVKLNERCGGLCELCNSSQAVHEYTVSPKTDDKIENQVALCDVCSKAVSNNDYNEHRHFLEGSIWNPEPAVQALSYRLLYACNDKEWALAVLNAADIDENTAQWALTAFEVADVHKDAFGNTLENGDNVVLTQALNVKGTNFTAAKGTIVKRIRLVPDNVEQIEGKVNDQLIVIITKFVKKG